MSVEKTLFDAKLFVFFHCFTLALLSEYIDECHCEIALFSLQCTVQLCHRWFIVVTTNNTVPSFDKCISYES